MQAEREWSDQEKQNIQKTVNFFTDMGSTIKRFLFPGISFRELLKIAAENKRRTEELETIIDNHDNIIEAVNLITKTIAEKKDFINRHQADPALRRSVSADQAKKFNGFITGYNQNQLLISHLNIVLANQTGLLQEVIKNYQQSSLAEYKPSELDNIVKEAREVLAESQEILNQLEMHADKFINIDIYETDIDHAQMNRI